MLLFYSYFLSLFANCFSHTFLITPPPRVNNLCIPAVDNSNCCRTRPPSTTTTYQRGQIINTQWGRNNHVGGFIRFALVPLSQSDIPNIFNNNSHIIQYNCYAPQCVGVNNNFFNGDPPGTPFNANVCSMKLKIPDWLPDGDYTLQWRWHSGGDNYNMKNLGLRDFVSCHDFKITGGPVNPKPACPLFIGGDASNPNLNACEFFRYNDINTCTQEFNCFSWYAKAPPKAILQCPSNILPGGMTNALNNIFLKGASLPLYIGNSNQPYTNPGNAFVNLNLISSYLTTTPIIQPTTSIQLPLTTPILLPSSTPINTPSQTRIVRHIYQHHYYYHHYHHCVNNATKN